MRVANKTPRPLAVPLPGGRTLRLGPLGVGQIAPNAVSHPPIKKLVDAGAIEITDEGPTRSGGFSQGRTAGAWGRGHASGAGGRRSGDR